LNTPAGSLRAGELQKHHQTEMEHGNGGDGGGTAIRQKRLRRIRGPTEDRAPLSGDRSRTLASKNLMITLGAKRRSGRGRPISGFGMRTAATHFSRKNLGIRCRRARGRPIAKVIKRRPPFQFLSGTSFDRCRGGARIFRDLRHGPGGISPIKLEAPELLRRGARPARFKGHFEVVCGGAVGLRMCQFLALPHSV